MADEITVYDSNTNNGTVTYANDVIATIAGVAATEVSGVAGMSGGISSGITEMLGKRILQKALRLR